MSCGAGRRAPVGNVTSLGAALALVAIGGAVVIWKARSSRRRRMAIELEEIDVDGTGELAACIRAQRHQKQRYFRLVLPSGREIGVGRSSDTDWIDIFARRHRKPDMKGQASGDFECLGFSMTASRWSYGEGPYGAKEIRAALHEYFGGPEKIGRFR